MILVLGFLAANAVELTRADQKATQTYLAEMRRVADLAQSLPDTNDDGEIVLVTSRRGAVEAPARIDPGLRPGLVFMTFHFPDEVAVNQLTIDATDPKSGTAEFKAAAVRIDRISAGVAAAPPEGGE